MTEFSSRENSMSFDWNVRLKFDFEIFTRQTIIDNCLSPFDIFSERGESKGRVCA